jgi:hypothetical protein
LSASRAMELQRARLEDATLEEKLEHNAWGMTRLADPNKPVIVPHVLQEMGWADVDFLKIDIDGPDFLVLNSFEGQFDRLGLLAARLEVNLTGASDPTENVFHNTDRFMRERGFELFALDVRLYSLHALPAPFAITAPAQTRTGRPFQAEAFYARDPAGPDWADFGAGMSVEKLLKLAAIFSIWNEPDSAAEILIRFRDRLQGVFDVDAGLDLLAAQAQPDIEQPLSYKDYIASFEANAPQFYPPVPRAPSPPTLKQRLSASFRAFLNPADRPNG